jgi:ArsR family transcriptional regulator, arsenate/arsenite/antimonite-responsive transcriptional repressor
VESSAVVDSNPVELTAGFAALADPVRLRVIGVLAGGGRCVCDLHEQVPVAGNVLSYHLKVLREAGLVSASKRGRWVDYCLNGAGFAALWVKASAVGVPLSGEQVTNAWAGRACATDGQQ